MFFSVTKAFGNFWHMLVHVLPIQLVTSVSEVKCSEIIVRCPLEIMYAVLKKYADYGER